MATISTYLATTRGEGAAIFAREKLDPLRIDHRTGIRISKPFENDPLPAYRLSFHLPGRDIRETRTRMALVDERIALARNVVEPSSGVLVRRKFFTQFEFDFD
ncbi:uncharacterized protein LOC110818816 [Carica papaya]|uniref:uncharacterized protein LOC110818816 n=1 Tax=Carica papaya TaxID=3649 RepID=UPI000B8C8537|nr:uncharacterized protein LOC110818816 [Carica papaya]